MIIAKRRRRGNTKFLIAIVAMAVVIVILLLALFLRGSEAITDSGYLSIDYNYDAVIVRSEKAVTTDSFDRADYFVREGKYADAGTHVMDVYKRGYNDELMLSLQQTEQEIYAAQLEQLGETRDSVLNGYNQAVDALESQIAEAVMNGNTDEVAQLEIELKLALTERGEYLRNTLQETETLRALYKTKQEKEALISTWRSSIVNEIAGTISFYFDDYENALNEDKLSIMTSDLITSVIKGKGAVEWTTEAENLAYRVVDTSHWYCVFLTPAHQALRTVQGMSYSIDVAGYGQFAATALEPMISGMSAINILRINQEMGELINVRTVKVKVKYDASGIEVKLDGIIIEDGQRYIELMYSEGKKKAEIDVLSVDGDSAIIRVKNPDEQAIVAGVRYWIPKKKLSLKKK